MGVGASISLAMAAVLLQGAVLVRTRLTLRALRRQLGFGTRRLLRAAALGAATRLGRKCGWSCRDAGAAPSTPETGPRSESNRRVFMDPAWPR